MLQLQLVESFVCYRVVDLVESYVSCESTKLYLVKSYI